MRTKLSLVVVILPALALMAIACGGTPTKPSDQPPTPTQFTLTPSSTSVVAGTQVTVTAVNAPGMPNWNVAPSANLQSNGMSATLVPMSAGTYTVSANAGGQSASATVTVTQPTPTPPEGTLGLELAFGQGGPNPGGPYGASPPITKPVTVVIPSEVVPYRQGLDAAALRVQGLLGVPVSVSTGAGTGHNVQVKVVADIGSVCITSDGSTAGACLGARDTLYIQNPGMAQSGPGMSHELGHLLLYHCTHGSSGCGIMSPIPTGTDFTPAEKAVAAWLQAGAK